MALDSLALKNSKTNVLHRIAWTQIDYAKSRSSNIVSATSIATALYSTQ